MWRSSWAPWSSRSGRDRAFAETARPADNGGAAKNGAWRVSKTDLDALIGALDAAPGNVFLRLVAIRRCAAEGQGSRALALALDLSPGEVEEASDRDLIAQLLRRAGLEAQAAAFAAAPASPPPAEPPAPAPAPERGARVLRLVGGADATDQGQVVSLPEPPEAPVTFADVGGLDEVKKDISRRIVLPFREPGIVARFRKRSGGGVLMYGPPGCGKTLLARATAGECQARFHPVAISDVLDPYIGASEQRLSQVFATARSETPAVLFFDEIDALGAKRSQSTSSHVTQLASHFLNEMDGVGARNAGVLVLAATNAPWLMDPAFLRPGRFDRLFFVPPPDRAARQAIFDLELQGRALAADIDPGALAAATSGFSGADVRAVVERASDAAIDATLDAGAEMPITQGMLMRAAKDTRSSVNDWLATARNYATYSNESGRYDDILKFLEQHAGRK